MSMRRWTRWLAGFAAALAVGTAGLVAGTVALPAVPAAAHASLVASDPPNGAELAEPPPQVRLRFTERVSLPPGGVALRNATGAIVPSAPAFVVADEPSTVVLPVPADLPVGGYLVTFRVVSADSHPVVGAIAFGVGAAPASLAGAALDDAGTGVPAVFAAARWISYAGLALLAGGLVMLALCWPAGWALRRPRRLLTVGFAASLAGAVAVLLLQGPYAAGRSLVDIFDPGLLSATVDTGYGAFVLVRLGLVLIAGGLALAASADRMPVQVRDALALGLGLALPATWAGTGHAATGGVVDAVAETAHVVAMMAWFGGLAMLAICLLPRSAAALDAAQVGPALRRFSTLATGAVAVLVATGIYVAWRRVGSLDGLIGTVYGRLLAVKLAAIGVLLWLGGLSRSVVRRRYAAVDAFATDPYDRQSRSKRRAARAARADERAARAQLHQSVRLEVVFAITVLGIASVLVATPPGVVVRTAEAAASTLGEPVLVEAPVEPDGAVRVLVDPAAVGENRVVIEVLDRRSEPWDVPEVRASFLSPEGDDIALPVPLERVQAGVFTATGLPLPFPGDWRLRVTVRTTDIDSTTVLVDTPVQ
ncbi:MAG TPA: copper resistance protein CopC [Micromonosporaceae bacterium]|nr:copper resistance protein CopC [Micromonosporaceae bacterium]